MYMTISQNVIEVEFLDNSVIYRCYKNVVYKEANKMTEEFNESMINDIKEGDKVTGEVQQVEDKQVVVSQTVVTMGLFL